MTALVSSGKVRAQCLPVLAQHASVVARVGEQQDDPGRTAVRCLGLATSLECLEVVQPRLGIDAYRAWAR